MKNKFLKNRGYLIKKLQYEIFDAITAYMSANKLNQTKLATKLNVSKGYVSQLMNANFDHKLSKLVDLAIAIGKVPTIQLEDVDKYLSKSVIDQQSITPLLPYEEEDPKVASEAKIIPINSFANYNFQNGGQQISIQA